MKFRVIREFECSILTKENPGGGDQRFKVGAEIECTRIRDQGEGFVALTGPGFAITGVPFNHLMNEEQWLKNQQPMVYEPGAMDSLWSARRAVESAIMHYKTCDGYPELISLDEGPLFAAMDFCDTAVKELADFKSIAGR